MPVWIREYGLIMSDRKHRIVGGIHPYHELLYLSAGELLVRWNGREYATREPALLLFPSSTPHQLEQLTPRLECWFVELRLLASDSVPDAGAIRAWNASQAAGAGIPPDISETLETIDRAVREDLPRTYGDLYHRILACDIQKLLLQVDWFVSSRRPSALRASAKEKPRQDRWSAQGNIYETIRYLEDHYAEEIGLTELARKSGYTSSYIIRMFKEMTGMTPMQYLYELRMNAAAAYLRTTRMSVRNVAEAIGIPSLHYFSRVFKRKFGLSPTEWKKANTVKEPAFP